MVLGLLVERAGGTPILLGTAAEAHARVSDPGAPPVWLAIVDKNLPDGSGLELLRWLRERTPWPGVEVMVVTGYGNVDSAIEALRLGAFDYILKPFESAWVVRRIELALEQRGLRLALRGAEDELRRNELETVDVAGRAAELLEPHAAGHARRTSVCAGILARTLGGTEAWIDAVEAGALLHDIGNVGVPGRILSYPGPLEPAELAAARAHVTAGVAILRGATGALLTMAREIVLTHHERWDGSGYPVGLRGEEIPLAGRIVGLVDVWDAMLARRPYRDAMPVDHALAYLRAGSGTLFDPRVVEAFLELVPRLLAATKV